MIYKKLYDDQKYIQSHLQCLIDLKNQDSTESILYIIKNIITHDGYKIMSISQLKKLLFLYFYKKGEIKFENGFIIYIDNINYKIRLQDISNMNLSVLEFKNIIDYGKNEIFLGSLDNTDNLIDHLLYFVKANSELYAFEGENFPLFKWLINELVD